MAKRYTFMFFSTDRLGKVRTVTVSKNLILLSVFAVVLVTCALAASLYNANQLRAERASLIEFNEENNALKAQLAQYTQQIEDISSKIAILDDLEYRIKDLVDVQKDNIPLKPVAVGGKEVDLLREYSSTAALNEKNFFNTLDGKLKDLSYEVEQHELNLSELAVTLEEKRIVMLSTPTIMPVNGWVSSQFGYRVSPFSGRQTFHEGIDISARSGIEVHAAANGEVIFAGVRSAYGNMVIIDHGHGYVTKYGHNSENLVKVGDKVTKGQTIAKVGNTGRSTGYHVHYEVVANGIPVNPAKFVISGE